MRKRGEIIRQSKKRKWIKISIALTLIFTLAVTGFLYWALNQYEYKELNMSDEDLGIKEQPKKVKDTASNDADKKEAVQDEVVYKDEIINIALFGLDRRNSNDKVSRSDSIMVATLDFKHKKLKLTSIMRDTFVEIDGRGEDKLNHAYAYGGAPLAIKTINENYGLDIRNYVTVDFYMLQDLINAIGGVELDIKKEEIPLLNKHMQEIADKKGQKATIVTDEGKQLLTGEQAVAYARIRYVGNGDFERTERQQKVMESMIQKVKGLSKLELTSLFIKISPYIETSLKKEEIINMAWSYLMTDSITLEKMRYPLDGTWSADYTDKGAWVMKSDMAKQKQSIQSYLYDDIHPYNGESDKASLTEKVPPNVPM